MEFVFGLRYLIKRCNELWCENRLLDMVVSYLSAKGYTLQVYPVVDDTHVVTVHRNFHIAAIVIIHGGSHEEEIWDCLTMDVIEGADYSCSDIDDMLKDFEHKIASCPSRTEKEHLKYVASLKK